MTTVTIQPAQADTVIIESDASTVYGAGSDLAVGNASDAASTAFRSLLKFDLSGIPTGAVVSAVTLSLYEYDARNSAGIDPWAVNVHRVLVNWSETLATWNDRITSTAWTAAGADDAGSDHAAAVSATLTMDGTAAGSFVNWTGAQLIADVQAIVDGAASNYGWLLIAPDAEYASPGRDSGNWFRSSNYGTAAHWPKLAITYTYVAPSTETLLDEAHFWRVYVDGTDRWQNVTGKLEWSEYEAGEVGTLRATLRETGTSLGLVEWQDVVLKDGSTAIWGGYITSMTPTANRLGSANRLAWDIVAESYETLLNRGRRVRKTYVNVTPGAILVDLFNRTLDPDGSPPNQSEFDTTTYVSAGSLASGALFAVDGDKLTDVLDRLALLAGFVWWIDADKAVHFGAASASTAPFGIKLAAAANYSTFFPPVANTVDAKTDATDIRNVVTVYGGVKVSSQVTDNFTGNGSTLMFHLSNFPIVEVISVTVGGVAQSFGTDWYHSFSDYDCLVNYSHGTVRWNLGDAPPNGDAVVVKYRHGEQVVVRVSNSTSIAYYGRSFEYEVTDRSITSLATATAIANAMLDRYAYGTVAGSFSVGRLGIKAGQRVQIEFSALSLTGYYQVRRVVGSIGKGGRVTLTVQFGGPQRKLSAGIGSSTGSGPVTSSGAPGLGSSGDGTPGAVAKDQYGLQLSVPDYGSASLDSITQPSKAVHVRFKNSSEDVLHRIEAYSDYTDTGVPRERLVVFGGGGDLVDKYGYTVLQTVAQREAWTRIRAVGGYGDAGQQDASLHLYAYRKNGVWDHSRAYLDTDTVQVKQWSDSSAPDPGTDSLPDGLLVYTDGTWNPGSGEGWYIRISAAWRPIAVVAGAVMQIGATLDLLDYHLRSVGNLEFANANTQQSNFTAGANTVYVVGTGSGNVTATLPALSSIGDSDVRLYVFIKVSSDGNQMIIDGDGSETINGATTQSTTTQYTVFRVMSRGTEWLLW